MAHTNKVYLKDYRPLDYEIPNIDINTFNPSDLEIQFASTEAKVMEPRLKNTKATCVPKGGGLQDAMEVTVYYYQVPYKEPASILCATAPSGQVVYSKKVSSFLYKDL